MREELKGVPEKLDEERGVGQEPQREPAVDQEGARRDDEQHVDDMAREERARGQEGRERGGPRGQRELGDESPQKEGVPGEDQTDEQVRSPRREEEGTQSSPPVSITSRSGLASWTPIERS